MLLDSLTGCTYNEIIEAYTLRLVRRELANLRLESTPDDPELLDSVIRMHTLKILEQTGGNKIKTAEVMGIGSVTLHRWLKTWNRVQSANL